MNQRMQMYTKSVFLINWISLARMKNKEWKCYIKNICSENFGKFSRKYPSKGPVLIQLQGL